MKVSGFADALDNGDSGSGYRGKIFVPSLDHLELNLPSTAAMSLLHVLLLVGAITINIPWLLVIRRRGRIASHSKSRLRLSSQRRYWSGAEEDENLSAGVGKTLKTHVRSGLL